MTFCLNHKTKCHAKYISVPFAKPHQQCCTETSVFIIAGLTSIALLRLDVAGRILVAVKSVYNAVGKAYVRHLH